MNYFFISLFLLLTGCFMQSNDETALIDRNFEIAIKSYLDENKSILNSCNAKPFYKVYFKNVNDTIGFWIGAHLGEPSPVLPIEPERTLPADPIEIKGVCTVNKCMVVIYDYKQSNGYGLYNNLKLKPFKTESFEKLPDECINVWYPEALYYTTSADSIYITNKRESFQLK